MKKKRMKGRRETENGKGKGKANSGGVKEGIVTKPAQKSGGKFAGKGKGKGRRR